MSQHHDFFHLTVNSESIKRGISTGRTMTSIIKASLRDGRISVTRENGAWTGFRTA